MAKSLHVAFLMTIACLFAGVVIGAERERSHVHGRFLLVLNGVNCGYLTSVEGGGIDAEVIEEAHPSHYVKKHLGPVQYGEFSLQTGIGEFPLLNAWSELTTDGKQPRSDGAFVSADVKYAKQHSVEFQKALITAIEIPACDVSAKDSGLMTFSFLPELTKRQRGGGEPVPKQPRPAKSWLRSDFILSIPGIDCRKVSKIDSITIKQAVVRDQVGQERDYQLTPGKIEYPNLVVTLPNGAAETWLAWHKEFVIEGKNDDSLEKTGTLVFLSQNRKTVLLTLTFHHLGIFAVDDDDQDDKDGKAHRLKAKMYCERMTVDFHDDDGEDPKSPKANGSLIP